MRFIEPVSFTRQNCAQVEPEAVDMHFGRPVAQAVGHHLHNAGMAHVQRVAGAGVVDVVARIVRHQTIIGQIVDATERQGRAVLVALGRVVVDDVQNDLQPGIVQAGDHLLEF